MLRLVRRCLATSSNSSSSSSSNRSAQTDATRAASEALARLSALNAMQSQAASPGHTTSQAAPSASPEALLTWRQRLGTPAQRALLWRAAVAAAVSVAVLRYYYGGHTHAQRVAASAAALAALDAAQAEQDALRTALVVDELRRRGWSSAELAEAERLLHSVGAQLRDVERVADAQFDSPQANNAHSGATTRL